MSRVILDCDPGHDDAIVLLSIAPTLCESPRRANSDELTTVGRPRETQRRPGPRKAKWLAPVVGADIPQETFPPRLTDPILPRPRLCGGGTQGS
jgi:hypothetical protein